ncbi:hypothetical protein J2T61_001886 [Methanocalculus sp. AMF5]|nr:hypothetical protein [Methanocalculus sp. AMF5]
MELHWIGGSGTLVSEDPPTAPDPSAHASQGVLSRVMVVLGVLGVLYGRICWRGRGGKASVWLSEEICPETFGIAFQVALMSKGLSPLPACLFRLTPPPYTRAAAASLILIIVVAASGSLPGIFSHVSKNSGKTQAIRILEKRPCTFICVTFCYNSLCSLCSPCRRGCPGSPRRCCEDLC